MVCRLPLILSMILPALLAGCAHSPNPFREDGPSVDMAWETPTSADVYQRDIQPALQRHRDWEVMTVAAENGAVTHWPLYFEDPFVMKGDGRTDETHPFDVYRLGWEDYVAFPYGFARYTLNWLALPVTMVVQPPWTLMESDGRLSKQCLGYDHDAVPVKRDMPAEPPAAPDDDPPPGPDQPDVQENGDGSAAMT